MNARNDNIDSTRRAFVTRSAWFAAGSAALAAPLLANASPSPRLCWDSDRMDATRTDFGHLRVVRFDVGAKTFAVPILIAGDGDRAAIDLTAATPTIRVGLGARRVMLSPGGISFKEGQIEEKWTSKSVGKLLALLVKDEELRKALYGLRLAVHTLYPEYLFRGKAAAPKKLAEHRQKSAARSKDFGHRPAAALCNVQSVVDIVTSTITTAVNVVLTAAQQFQRCTDACYQAHLQGSKDDYIGYGFCEADCLGQTFQDLVTGTMDVVESVTEEVTRQVTTCVSQIPNGVFPDPFRGLPRLDWLPNFAAGATATTTATDTSPDVVAKGIDVLLKLTKDMPAAIGCLLKGAWSITRLSDLKVNIPGIESVPVGVTVCVDHTCALTMTGIGLLTDIVSMINNLTILVSSAGVAAEIALLGLTGAAAAAVAQIIPILIAVLIVLLAHLAIVAGQILFYDTFGLIDGGICITHPSLPVAVAGAINPLLGILALGNMPLIVTPR